jgi:hypothetical protein
MRCRAQFDSPIIMAAFLSVVSFSPGDAPASNGFQNNEASSQAVPRDTLIRLERTVCFGTCPSYKLTIKADGSVTFEGHRCVKHIGTAKSAIPREQLRKLLAMFEETKFFDLKDQYISHLDGCESEVTDNPSAITSITVNGKSKTVTHYYGCLGIELLDHLAKLERAIDNAVSSDQWIR